MLKLRRFDLFYRLLHITNSQRIGAVEIEHNAVKQTQTIAEYTETHIHGIYSGQLYEASTCNYVGHLSIIY